jgi:hypothetical protein
VADRAQVPWKGAPERVRAPSCPDPIAPRGTVGESGCLGMQPQSGGKFRPRLNMGERPIANKYCCKQGRGGRFKTWGMSRGGAVVGADLGGSSKYSNQNFEGRRGERFHVNGTCTWVSRS